MKSQRGITLTSLVIYIIAMAVIMGIIATITSFFYSNTTDMNESTTNLGEFNKFNVAFLEETKKNGNSVLKVESNNTKIVFTSGTAFTFQDEGIYQDKIKIVTGVTNCQFEVSKKEEKEIVKVLIEIGKNVPFVKTVEYVMAYENISSTEDDEKNYSQDSNSYAKDGLQLYYDAINNTGDGHSNTTTAWKDLSGNHRDGVLENFSNSSTSGWTENSLIFDGTNDGVFIGNQLIDLFKSNNTVEILFSVNETNTRDILIGNYNKSNSINYEIKTDTFRIWINDGTYQDTTTEIIDSANTIKMITVVFDKDNGKIKVFNDSNFLVEFESSEIANYNYNWTNVRLGRDVRPESMALNGKIYAVRVYSKILTQTEIVHNYELDKERYEF